MKPFLDETQYNSMVKTGLHLGFWSVVGLNAIWFLIKRRLFMTDLASGSLGSGFKWDVSFSAGSLTLTAAYTGSAASGSASFSVSSLAGLEELKLQFPNVFVGEIINVAEAALKLV